MDDIGKAQNQILRLNNDDLDAILVFVQAEILRRSLINNDDETSSVNDGLKVPKIEPDESMLLKECIQIHPHNSEMSYNHKQNVYLWRPSPVDMTLANKNVPKMLNDLNGFDKFGKMKADQQKLDKKKKETTVKKPLKATCNKCNKNFESVLQLVDHRRTHSEQVMLTCPICQTVFKTKSHVTYHLMQELRLFECSTCGTNFRTEYDLRGHLCGNQVEKKKVQKKTMNLPTFTCVRCGCHFSMESHLQRHKNFCGMRSHNNDLKCNLCSQRSRSIVALLKHRLRHSVHTMLTCTKCPKRFATFDAIQKHLTIEYRIFVCKLCNEAFCDGSELAAHYCTGRQIAGEPDEQPPTLTSCLTEQSTSNCGEEELPKLVAHAATRVASVEEMDNPVVFKVNCEGLVKKDRLVISKDWSKLDEQIVLEVLSRLLQDVVEGESRRLICEESSKRRLEMMKMQEQIIRNNEQEVHKKVQEIMKAVSTASEAEVKEKEEIEEAEITKDLEIPVKQETVLEKEIKTKEETPKAESETTQKREPRRRKSIECVNCQQKFMCSSQLYEHRMECQVKKIATSSKKSQQLEIVEKREKKSPNVSPKKILKRSNVTEKIDEKHELRRRRCRPRRFHDVPEENFYIKRARKTGLC